MATGCACCRKKQRDEKEVRDLLHRLSRIEGQIRGLKGMVEQSAYCPDILVQVSAAEAALHSFGRTLLASHIRTCAAGDIHAGKEGAVEELVALVQKLTR